MAEQVAASASHTEEEEVKTETTKEEVSPAPKSPTGSTASGSGGGGSWGLWGWVESAKTKSFAVLDAVKKDLDELSTVVKEEANAASEALGLHQPDSTVGVMKKSISSFLGQVSDVLVPPVEEEEAEAIMITKDGMVSLTGFAKHLAELQANDATYLQEPTDVLLSQYKRWLEVIEQDQFTEPRLTRQLTNSQILNEKYLSLVPAKVSHMEFWKRYLFKKALLEDAVANAESVAKKAEAEAACTDTVIPEKIIIQTEQPKMSGDEDELKKWEEDICASNIELSEEEQARLLEEYEKEIKEREPVKEEPTKKPAAAVAKKQQQPKGNTSKSAQGKSNNTNPKATKSRPTKQTGAKQKNNEANKEDTTSDESWEKDFDDVMDQQK